MKRIFANDHQRAVAYAAMKMLERMLKTDGDLPAGTYDDVSFESLTVQLPKGTVVERDLGTKGDGSMFKTATQNLYGYAVLAAVARQLKKFNQWDKVKELLLDAVREAVKHKKPTEDVLIEQDADFAELLLLIKKEISAAPRKEETPRIVKDPGRLPTLTFVPARQKVACF